MSYSTNAAGVSKYTAERHQRILQDLLQQPGNDICADCKSRAPRWSSWNLGIFICVQCASIHRKIGTHITKVKSVNLDAWSKEQIESVKTIGNLNTNAKWNPNESMHPPPTNLEESERDSEMEKYIRGKYETKKFMNRTAPSAIQTSTSSISSGNPHASASSASPSTTRPSKSDLVDPSQTVRLGFGRESRVEFSLTPGGGDMFDDILQQNKKVPLRSRTAPIPEPVVRDVKPAAPPVPPIPANLPSRSVSTQPLGGAGIGLSGMGAGAAASQMGMGMGQMGVGQMGAGQMGAGQIGGGAMGMGSGAGMSANPLWGDMMALQTGGPLPTQQQASPMQQNNPYASLGVAPSLPSTLANRVNQARSFTAPASGMGGAPNPFFQNQAAAQQQQPFATGSTGSSMLSVPTGSSFGSMSSGGMMPAATGGSYGSMSSGSFGTGAGGMGTSPGGAFGGGSLGVSPGGAFGTSPGGLQSTGFGTSPSGLGTSMLPPNSGQAFSQASSFQQNTMSPFQQNTTSPFGGAGAGAGGPSGPSMSAFGAAMSPGGGASNSPYAQGAMSNSPYQQTNTSAFQPSSSLFQSTGGSQFQPSSGFQQTTPSYLQSNSGTSFQPNPSLYPQSNSPYQSTNTAFAPGQMNTNPFGSFGSAGGGANTNPFGQQQQQQQQQGQFQFQGQGQGQGWGGM